MFKQTILFAVLALTGLAGAENATITWTSGTTYEGKQASVGDTVTFEYSTSHNVYIHPTGNCSEADKILVGGNEDSPASYTFAESDAGNTITFACDTGSHCEGGQIIDFTIPAMGGGDGPTGAPGSSDDSASAALGATLAVASAAAAAMMF
eukprot:scaffold3857_cov127-Cylindrotheca_fusiformis.AAC.7